MKKILLIAGLILLVSCSSDDSTNQQTNNANSEIVGSWELYKIVLDDGSEITDVTDDYSTYVFNSDGTGVYIISGTGASGEVQGTWDYVNSKYRFNGDELNLIDENTFWKESAINGETDYYRRITSLNGATGDSRNDIDLSQFTHEQLRTILVAGGANGKWILDYYITDNGTQINNNDIVLRFLNNGIYQRAPLYNNRTFTLGQHSYWGDGTIADTFNNLRDLPNSAQSSTNRFNFYEGGGDIKFSVESDMDGIGNGIYHFIKY